jgi:hypothetical protein
VRYVQPSYTRTATDKPPRNFASFHPYLQSHRYTQWYLSCLDLEQCFVPRFRFPRASLFTGRCGLRSSRPHAVLPYDRLSLLQSVRRNDIIPQHLRKRRQQALYLIEHRWRRVGPIARMLCICVMTGAYRLIAHGSHLFNIGRDGVILPLYRPFSCRV